MLFVSTSSPTLSHPIEWRLDLQPWTLPQVKALLHQATHPIMLTPKIKEEALLQKLVDLHPPYLDLDYDLRPQFIYNLLQNYPKTKFVLSYHGDKNIETVYATMKRYPAHHYKIAKKVATSIEALHLLLFAKKNPDLTVIPIGDKASFARILSPILGGELHYTYEIEKTAEGQLPLQELTEIYDFSNLTTTTAIYGLIGYPIDHSIGHMYHNRWLQEEKIPAVYVKIPVKAEELQTFMSLANEIGIQGLSVTTPLKEKILPFIDDLDNYSREIGAANTLFLKNGRRIGTNTDGIGAFNALKKRRKAVGAKVIVIGKGAAARAIAYEGEKRGAKVTLIKRGEKVMEPYDILINATPQDSPIFSEEIQKNTLVMDLNYKVKETTLLQEALKKGCTLSYGEEMFYHQAEEQKKWWLALSN